MNIKLIVVAKTDAAYLQEGIALYEKRLRHYAGFEMVVIPALKDTKNLDIQEIKQREGQLLLRQMERCDRLILLDEHGKKFTSMSFADHLQRQMNAGVRNLGFVVGGAYGFSEAVYAAAHERISLSDMTFNHQMVRLFFVEQLYRAFTILHHEPYHNE